MEDLSAFSARPRLRALLDHFATIKDTRQTWKVMYPLREVLLLVVCGTIASGDDYDDIVDWGNAHLALLRGFAFPAYFMSYRSRDRDDERSQPESYIMSDRTDDSKNGVLSLSSPLGKALSEASPGDEFAVRLGDRERTVLFVAVEKEKAAEVA